MDIGDEGFEIVDWDDLWARIDSDESVIPGLALKGRWAAIASQAKAGKSTVLLGLAVDVARAGVSVLYLDAEMGRADILDRLEYWMELEPADLANLHYSDLPPKLDTVQGATVLDRTVDKLCPELVVIDGLNGVVNGAENDDTTWRDFYEWAIAPLKARNIAVISADNLGKDTTMGPRGSSVKLDKADAVIILERTNEGAKLTATHRRTVAYPAEQHYVIANASDKSPPMRVVRVEGSDPEGTSEIVAVLETLDLPADVGVRRARHAVREMGHQAANTTIDAAVRIWRQIVPEVPGTLQLCPDVGAQITITPASTTSGTVGARGAHPPNGDVPESPGTSSKAPGRWPGPRGVSTKDTPPQGASERHATKSTADDEASEIKRQLMEQFE